MLQIPKSTPFSAARFNLPPDSPSAAMMTSSAPSQNLVQSLTDHVIERLDRHRYAFKMAANLVIAGATALICGVISMENESEGHFTVTAMTIGGALIASGVLLASFVLTCPESNSRPLQ